MKKYQKSKKPEWDIFAIKNTLIEIPVLWMIWTISQSNRRESAKKVGHHKK